MLNIKYENNSVLIDTEFIINEMKSINGEFVKVYLYTMYALQNNIDITYADIAENLGLLESEVMKAFDIFFEKGILKKVSHEETKKETHNKEDNESKTYINTERKQSLKATKEEMSEFCIIAEATMQRPLNTREIDTLYWIYNNLSLPAEVILMAIEYCIGEGRNDLKSVEKICIKWDKENINEIPLAQKFLEEQYKRKQIINKIKNSFDIKEMSKNDEELFQSWYFDMNMTEELISYAFDCCKNQINTVSLAYINTIIKNWYKEGIKTLEKAKENNENFKKKYNKSKTVSIDNGEYDDLANLTQN